VRGLPGTSVSRACLVVVNSTSCLNRGCGVACGEGAGHWWWGQWLRGEGAFRCFGGLASKGVEAVVVAMVMFGEVGVVNGAVVPKVGMPLQQDAVGVMAVDVRSQTPATPMPNL
jgi:hypothetical protein